MLSSFLCFLLPMSIKNLARESFNASTVPKGIPIIACKAAVPDTCRVKRVIRHLRITRYHHISLFNLQQSDESQLYFPLFLVFPASLKNSAHHIFIHAKRLIISEFLTIINPIKVLCSITFTLGNFSSFYCIM